MLHSPEFSLDEYEVSLRNGFLPDALPLQRLPSQYYAPWENVAQDLVARIHEGTIREDVESLPVLSTS